VKNIITRESVIKVIKSYYFKTNQIIKIK